MTNEIFFETFTTCKHLLASQKQNVYR